MTGSVSKHLRQNAVAYLALFVALGGTGAFAATVLVSSDGTVSGCVAKKGKHKGALRVVKPGARCKRSETAIAFNQRGVPGAQGASGEQGLRGEPGQPGSSGSPDTPSQVLEKLKQVDGDGSALDSDLLDGHETAFFQRRGSATVCATGSVVNGLDVSGDVNCASDATAPSGPAGGDLTGSSYPNPQIASGAVTADEIGTLPHIRYQGSVECTTGMGSQTIPNNTETKLEFRTLVISTPGWATATEPGCTSGFSRFTTPRAGTYVISAGLLWDSAVPGRRGIDIRVNGQSFGSERHPASDSGDTHSNVTTVVDCPAGAQIEVFAYQTAGGAVLVTNGIDPRNYFAAAWLGP
jgi:hypothetical protein